MAVFEAGGGRKVVTAEDMLASSGLDGSCHFSSPTAILVVCYQVSQAAMRRI